MPPAGARGPPRGGALSTTESYRCAPAAEERGEDLAGTATHLRGFLLVEHHGPWGERAPADSRLPPDVRRHLVAHRSIRTLLARRHHRAHRAQTYRVLAALPARRLLVGSTYRDPEDLLGIDLGAMARGVVPDWPQVEGPLYGVCTHGRHDACCAVRGRPLAAALTALRPEQTWEVSHLGGDRFAANVLVLPEGLYYGRVGPDDASLLATRHEQGRLDLEHLRGRTSYPNAVQYAEIALRRRLGDDRAGTVRLVRRDGLTSVLSHDGVEWEVAVSRRSEGAVRLTCSALRLNPVPVFSVVRMARVGDQADPADRTDQTDRGPRTAPEVTSGAGSAPPPEVAEGS